MSERWLRSSKAEQNLIFLENTTRSVIHVTDLVFYLSWKDSFSVNQCVSDSPSKIRGGKGALMLQEKVL